MLIHLSECSQMIDPKAGLLTWEECGEKSLNAKGARLLNKEMIQKYINIPGNPSKLVVGRTYYQVGIQVKTDLKHAQFIAKWNNARYEAKREQGNINWITIKAAEVQESHTAYAVGYFAGTTERGDYDTVQKCLQEICKYPVEISYQLLNQNNLTKSLWKEARESALRCNSNTQSRAYKNTLFKLAPAALTVYVYSREHIKETNHFLMEEYGEALDDGAWPTLQDKSRAKFIPVMRKTPKRADVKEYLEASMVNQILSKSVEKSINIEIWDIKEKKEYLKGQSIEQILHSKLSERRDNVPLIKHIARRWTKITVEDDSYEIIVQPNMYDEAHQFIKTIRNTLVKEYGSEVTKHFWAKRNFPSAHGQYNNDSHIDISEDDDELLISKLNKKKDTYSMVLVEGMDIVKKDIEKKEQRVNNGGNQIPQNDSQNEMSGLTSIREEVVDQSIRKEQNSEKEKRQVSFQREGVENKSENDKHQTTSEVSEEKTQEDNNSRMSGFTSVLENNSLTTNIWELSKEQKTAEKLRRSREIKVKNTLAQFNVSSNQIVEWTSKNVSKYQEFSNQAKHDEYNTLKLVIKEIIKKRSIQDAQDDAFNKMMVLSNKKAKECQQNENTPINHPNQRKSSLKPKRFKKWGQSSL